MLNLTMTAVLVIQFIGIGIVLSFITDWMFAQYTDIEISSLDDKTGI